MTLALEKPRLYLECSMRMSTSALRKLHALRLKALPAPGRRLPLGPRLRIMVFWLSIPSLVET
jgi:hypothetical protein